VNDAARSVAMSTSQVVSLCWCWRRTSWTFPRPTNFSREFHIRILALLQRHFSAYVRKPHFLTLHGSMFTHARWSKTFWCCNVHNLFLINVVQKLSKLVKICKSCRIKFIATFFKGTQCIMQTGEATVHHSFIHMTAALNDIRLTLGVPRAT